MLMEDCWELRLDLSLCMRRLISSTSFCIKTKMFSLSQLRIFTQVLVITTPLSGQAFYENLLCDLKTLKKSAFLLAKLEFLTSRSYRKGHTLKAGVKVNVDEK